MNVFRLMTDPERYCNFAVRHAKDAGILDAFDGRPLATEWEAPDITAADVDDDLADLPDYALLGTVPVLSARATVALLDVLRFAGELLPLRYRRAEYLAYNVTRVVDALDERGSTIHRFPTGRVMSVASYVFVPDRLSDAVIFKVPQLPKAHVFVTDEFVSRVAASALVGFTFPKIWDGRGAATS